MDIERIERELEGADECYRRLIEGEMAINRRSTWKALVAHLADARGAADAAKVRAESETAYRRLVIAYCELVTRLAMEIDV